MKVPYAYLAHQFADSERIFQRVRELTETGDYTLGRPVQEFESMLAVRLGIVHAIGVGSGTDGLKLALKAAGVGPGDEVVTAANTFIATIGAINDLGARPVLVDCDDSFCLDPDKLEDVLTSRTKAIVPVHLTGNMADMPRIMAIAGAHGLPVIEDACQALMSSLDGRFAGCWGLAGVFSLHPLKFINIWGDGGVIVTNDGRIGSDLRLLRNHGLADRDTVVTLGYNSRLDSLQAVVAAHVFQTADEIVRQRNQNAKFYDTELSGLDGIRVPPRRSHVTHTFVTYQLFARDRQRLLELCLANGVDCKVHYPVPVYLQPALRCLGYEAGRFPVADRHARTVITLPVHEYLTEEQLAYTVEVIRRFYAQGAHDASCPLH